ncbi:MAG: arginase [Pyrinomonadaceae bacterium]
MDRLLPGKGKTIGVLGAPLGFGAATVGSELGASAMRLTKFRGASLFDHLKSLGYAVSDHGNASIVVPVCSPDEMENPKYFDEVVDSCENISFAVRKVLEAGHVPLILGGDHTIAAGSLSGISTHFKESDQEIGLIWLDAHADMNTHKTSLSGNAHGMPFSAVLGHGHKRLTGIEGDHVKFSKEYVAHIGARDLDKAEKELIHELGLVDHFFTMSRIDREGMAKCVSEAIEIASKAPGGFAVTFDVDVIDPRFAPGSGTLVRGGITYREAHLALEMIHEAGGMQSFEIVEVNPILDQGNVTAEVACELILSAFGNVVL